MTKRYAEGTSVSTHQSRAEIDRLLIRYGATSFVSGMKEDAAMIASEMGGKRVKFVLPLPNRNAEEFTMWKRGNSSYFTSCPSEKAAERYEQACRERWRGLVLCIKAKLESVESKIETFEEAFLPHIVTATGQTVGELLLSQLPAITDSGRLPKLLA